MDIKIIYKDQKAQVSIDGKKIDNVIGAAVNMEALSIPSVVLKVVPDSIEVKGDFEIIKPKIKEGR